jgi:hypothetical protein
MELGPLARTERKRPIKAREISSSANPKEFTPDLEAADGQSFEPSRVRTSPT